MYISDKLVQSFQKTYERKFGQGITANEAKQDLSNLAELIKLIAKERKCNYGN